MFKRAIALFVCLSASPVAAQGGQEQPSLSDNALQMALDAARSDSGLVGMGATIWVDGEPVATAASGLRRKGGDVPVTKDDLWHVGSIGKSFTATILARLVEKDLAAWEMTVPDLLPDLADEMHETWHHVTLHHLLTHSSGFTGDLPISDKLNLETNPESLRELRGAAVAKLLKKNVTNDPGTQFQYSNAGYMIAGYIAETLSGQTYNDLIRTEIAEPLGLTSIGFGAPKGEHPWGHRRVFGINTAVDPEGRSDNTQIMAPAGTMHMSMGDLATYGQVHLDAGRSDGPFLSAQTFAHLHTPNLDEYGYGWIIMDRAWAGGPLVWHNGSNTMWYAILFLLSEKNAVMVFTTNDGNIAKADAAFGVVATEMATLIAPR